MSQFEWREGQRDFISVNGSSLETYCVGPSPESRPTIVLLHEGLGCVALWRDFPERLAKETGFGVFAYSRAGYGQSDAVDLPRPLNYMSMEAENTLPALLNHIEFKRGILLGHSDGATISAIYAGYSQDHRVRGLVLMAPHFFTEEKGLAAIREAKIAYESGDFRTRLGKYHKAVDVAFRGWNDAWLHPEFEQWNVADSIDYIRIPTLLVQGVDDQYGTIEQIHVYEERSYAPVDLCMLNNCQHSPHLDKPEATLDCIAEFCRRLEKIDNHVVSLF